MRALPHPLSNRYKAHRRRKLYALGYNYQDVWPVPTFRGTYREGRLYNLRLKTSRLYAAIKGYRRP